MTGFTKAVTVSAALLLSFGAVPSGGGAVFAGPDFSVVFPDSGADLRAAKPILDLIGFTEGTDRGDGYNETLAYGAYTNGDVDLTDMTLAEIDRLQTEMLRHPKNIWKSSAIGRYQIIRTTLRTLKKTLGLADSLKFTPELQDRLALELLRGRGYDAWKAGRITEGQFALNLSREWASLPNPNTGKGYYSGQSAAVGYPAVTRVFDKARQLRTRINPLI